MKSAGMWLVLLAAAAVIVGAGVNYSAGHDLSTLNGAARTAESAIALFVVPGLLPLLWWAFRKFKPHRVRGPLTAWTLFQCLMSLSSLAQVGTVTHATNDAPVTAYTFKPKRCEFSVNFAGKPREYTVQKADASGQLWPLRGAEQVLQGERGLLRAECVTLDSLDQSQLTDEFLTEAAQQIALDLGIQRTGISLERGRCGAAARISGVKETERGRLFVEVTNYHGKHSILTLYLAALSKDWKPEAMMTFTRSLQCHL